MLSLRSKCIRSFGPWAVAAALFFIAGGQWGVLQTAAWAGMLWNYSQQEGSLLSGAKKTFDGEHPCRLCNSIEKAKGKERSSPVAVASVKKIESFPIPVPSVLPPRACRAVFYPALSDLSAGVRPHAPPAPIPITEDFV